MIAKNVSNNEMYEAMDRVNKDFEGNIKFKGIKTMNTKGNRFNFTLTVESSKGKGGRIGFSGRRVCAACWHVHGKFFDHLLNINPNAVITSNWAGGKTVIDINGGNWQDSNIGSTFNPMMFSEACNCN